MSKYKYKIGDRVLILHRSTGSCNLPGKVCVIDSFWRSNEIILKSSPEGEQWFHTKNDMYYDIAYTKFKDARLIADLNPNIKIL